MEAPFQIIMKLFSNLFYDLMNHNSPGSFFDTWDINGGPGCTLGTYLPKAEDLREKLLPSLQPRFTMQKPPAVADAPKGEGKAAVAAGERNFLRIREKRLDAKEWGEGGRRHKGSHFPLCVFTNNTGRRSEERFLARAERQRQRNAAAGKGPMTEGDGKGGRGRGKGRGKWVRSSGSRGDGGASPA